MIREPCAPWVLLAAIKIEPFWRRRYGTTAERAIERESLFERFQPSDGRDGMYIVPPEPGYPGFKGLDGLLEDPGD